MPTYSFKCFDDEGGCGHEFEVIMSPATYTSRQPCPACRKRRHVHRHYEVDEVESQVKLADSEIKTVGHLAGRNRDNMSDEQLNQIKQKEKAHLYERQLEGFNKQLPPGMKRLELADIKEKPRPSLEQRREKSKELKEKAKEAAAKRTEQKKTEPRKLKAIE